ncbi:MAG TPA: DUF4126 family protein [Granulicella sp.]|jgi:uncharacterized membrane protein|nr:DUF4126 family protein [Granulicella sp.]
MEDWLLAIPVLGTMTGLRTFTPIAVACWFAYLGYLPVEETWAAWTGKLAAVVIFTLLAVAELVADKLPKVPNRTAPGPLLARLVFGGLVGAVASTGLSGSAFEGAFLGAMGALLGAFGGYLVRKYLVQWSGRPDWNLAVIEDASAVVIAIFALAVITG